MTKRERLSLALRRLRQVKEQEDAALRIHRAHELIKEIIEELSKGTKNAELGQHTTQLLDELYAQNTGALEDGRLPVPPVLPDCAEQIGAQTQALQVMTADDDATRRSETAAILRQTLSCFALGPNKAPIETFLATLDEQVKRANARSTSIPDCSEPIQVQTDALANLGDLDDPDVVRESAVSILRNVLSLFAQGPNATPIAVLLDTFNARVKWDMPRPIPIPDGSEPIQVQTDTLSSLEGSDNPQQMLKAVVNSLGQALSVFALGPNVQPVQTLLTQVDKTIEQAETLKPPLPDYAALLQPHIEQLEALVQQHDRETMSEAETTVLCNALSTMAQGPNEAPIRTLLAMVERLRQKKDLNRLLSRDAQSLQAHVEALTALEGWDDPDALTAAAAMTLYEALSEIATGSQAAPIQALLETFDKVTGAA